MTFHRIDLLKLFDYANCVKNSIDLRTNEVIAI